MFKSLQSRIAIFFISSLTLILLIILWLFSSEVYNYNKKLFIQIGNNSAEELAYKSDRLLQLGLLPTEFYGYDALCQKITDDTEGVIYVALIDHNNEIIFQGGDLSDTAFNMEDYDTDFTTVTNEYIIRKPLEITNHQPNYIILVIDQHLIENKLTQFLYEMLLYSGAVILVGILCVFYFLRSNLGKPIDSLIMHIKSVDMEPLSDENWDLLKRKDELSTVARTFHNMMKRLSRSQIALTESNSQLIELTNELESRVKLRTNELEKANKKLLSIAHIDDLTGLMNRRKLDDFLNDRFESAKRNNHAFAVLMADLNKFKALNDECGHAAGDFALQTIGRRILSSLRITDSVFRVGGDEFVFLIVKYDSLADLLVVLEKIKYVVDDPIIYNGLQLPLGISIGAACMTDTKDCEATDLLLLADAAMYEAKDQGVDYIIKNIE